MITSTEPGTWQELQLECARILSQCGFHTDVELEIALVRGQAVVDVYAEEIINGRKYAIICECKYWRSNIPQHVIHSFRTVVADGGLNAGYLITTSGFQIGAVEAAGFSNIELLTWPEFLNKFESSWYLNYFVDQFTDAVDDFLEFTEPFLPRWFDSMENAEQETLMEMHRRFYLAGPVLMSFTKYALTLKPTTVLPVLPLWNAYVNTPQEELVAQLLSPALLHAETYQDLLDAAIAYIEPVMHQFKIYDNKYHDENLEQDLKKTYFNHAD